MSKHFNAKVAKSREKNPKWRQSLVQGRLDAAMNPTRLRLARSKAGLSQQAICKKAKLTASTYGAIERGRRPVKEDLAKTLAEAVKGTVGSLFKQHKERPGKLLAA